MSHNKCAKDASKFDRVNPGSEVYLLALRNLIGPATALTVRGMTESLEDSI